MSNINMVLTGLLTASLAVACSAQPGTPDHRNQKTNSQANPVTPRDFTLETAVQAARADAAKQTGIAADALVLVSAENVTWPDGSIGCPAPGMAYTQALVPGYRIRLRGPAGELDYHASTRGGLVLCPAKRSVDPTPVGAYDPRI